MNVWALHNPKKERFYTSKTRQLHASHLKVGDRLWSCFPYLRPLATITADTLDYGIDADGAGVHDVIGSRQARKWGQGSRHGHEPTRIRARTASLMLSRAHSHTDSARVHLLNPAPHPAPGVTPTPTGC